ncbi:MAG: hypothetical protein ACRC2K_00325 [Clostridium sp.]
MGRGGVNRILSILITILIIWIVGSIFVAALPWLIIGGAIIWGIFKLRSVFRAKQNNSSAEETVYYERKYTKVEENKNEDVIDVDYEEIKK